MNTTEKTIQDLIVTRNACGSRIVLDGKSCIAPIDDKAFFDKCLMYSDSKNLHAKNTVAWRPMSDDWKEQCRSNSFWFQDTVAEAKKMFPGMDERLFELKARLLDFAGEAVCLPPYEEDLENILEYGQFWLEYNAEMVKGEACQCHKNSARVWQKNKDKTVICTGYALSADGMWRQHSWLIHRKPRSNRIVETTRPRVLYYGFAMSPELSERFADEVLDSIMF